MFEDFLVAALAASLLAYGGTCRPPDRHHLDTAGRIAMRPDLVWHRDGHPSAVVGAKHKVDRPSGFPDADLYQVLGYCTALDLAEGHLVYAKGNAEAQRHRGGVGVA